MIFSTIIVLYAQICSDLGLINDGLLELNDFISFIPIIFLNGYDRYSEPIVFYRILDKFHYSGVIIRCFYFKPNFMCYHRKIGNNNGGIKI